MSQNSLLIRKVLDTKHVRSFMIERAETPADDAVDNRTVELSFASDIPHEHFLWSSWEYVDIALSMDPKAVRTERLSAGAPLLMDHNTRDMVGVIEDFSIEKKEGKARATVRFSESARGEEIYKDVLGGIRQCVSVGFMIHKLTLKEQRDRKKGEIDLYEAQDWEPYEISLVAVPADISVGVGRSDDLGLSPEQAEAIVERIIQKVSNPSPTERAISKKEETTMTPEEIAAAAAAEANRSVETRSAELVIADEIREWGTTFGQAELATSYIRQNVTDDGKFNGTKAGFFSAVRAADPPTATPPPMDPQTAAERNGAPKQQLARIIPRHGRIKNFSGADENEKAEKAYRFGNWFLAGPMQRKLAGSSLLAKSQEVCRELGFTRTINESVNADGGFLVPEEFGNDLIDLRERFGVFRRYAKIVPMASDRRTDPAINGFVSTYFPEEEGEITAADLDFGQVGLTARKLAALVPVSNEWNEDSIVSSGDLVAGEIGKGFAYKEDLCGFNGDGTSTYGRIVGVREKLLGVDGTIANIAGLKVGAGNAYSELVLTDFEGVVALLPEFADSENAKWFVSRKFFFNVMAKLAYAAAGNAANDIVNGLPRRFLGYEVVFSQVMPSVEANSQVCAVLADLSLGASMGSRHDTRIAVSEHSRFKYDMLEIRGTERFDINPHGVGDTTNAGPIVGLITAAA